MNPRYSCLYPQRACPRKCSYCGSRNVRGTRLLEWWEWAWAIRKMEKVGVQFHLFLGNEVIIYPDIVELVRSMKGKKNYAMYTTFPQPIYSRKRKELIDSGLYNLSCGIDLLDTKTYSDKSITEKSLGGIKNLKYLVRKIPDVQGTITITRKNYKILPQIIKVLTRNKIWCGMNMVEHNLDGKFDFFGPNKIIKPFLLTDKDIPDFSNVMGTISDMIRSGEYMIQNPPEYFDLASRYYDMSWHCKHPLIMTIEEDGTFRCCGYRKGKRVSKFTIFDIGYKLTLDEYIKLQMEDRKECPGCYWSYEWMAEHYLTKDKLETVLDDKFKSHSSEYYKGANK